MYKKFLFLLMFFSAFGSVSVLTKTASAQEIVKEPICFMLRNAANFKVYGNFGTDYYTRPDGVRARHRSNFRLEPVGSVDEEGYPADKAEFCSYGPFYPGRKLYFTLRTLFPVFSCKTRIDAGEIVIHGERREDDSGVRMWADCIE